MSTFDSTKDSLQLVLQDVELGKIQLPDFQRSWVWNDEQIRSLLASVSVSYPIGSIMMLYSGSEDLRFRPRLVEGVEQHNAKYPDFFILDGQQRLTSLFLALSSKEPVNTKDARGKPIKRWYYLDIEQALSPDWDPDEAILSLPEDRRLKNFRGEVTADYSTTENECAGELLPLNLVFDVPGLTNWQQVYFQADPERTQERVNRFNKLVQTVIQSFQQYQLPLILLRKETPKEAVCKIFEKVNTGGVVLTVFDLLTATYAADDYNLRNDWAARRNRLKQHKALRTIESTDVLQVISLLTTRDRQKNFIEHLGKPEDAPGISCKRKDILRLSLDDYQMWADKVIEGFLRVAKFLHGENIFEARDLPYRTQIVPLAAIYATLGDHADKDGVKAKLARWYWCGILGELYGAAVESRFARDLPEVLNWVNGGPEPSTITEAIFSPSRLLTLRTRNSAAYKGLHAVLMRDGSLDFRTGEPIDVQLYFDERIDIHHIFPQDWCKRNGIDRGMYDSIVNKTAISAKTNRMIGKKPPSEYLARMEGSARVDNERMDQILSSHIIEPEYLRSDDFESFFKTREAVLLDRIEGAMGKPIARDAIKEVFAVGEYEEEEEEV